MGDTHAAAQAPQHARRRPDEAVDAASSRCLVAGDFAMKFQDTSRLRLGCGARLKKTAATGTVLELACYPAKLHGVRHA
jgi:hypothetical protein